MTVPGQRAHEIIESRLSEFLGPHTARVAVRTFSRSVPPNGGDAFDRERAMHLLEALRPMLKTLLGSAQTEDLIVQLRRELP